MYIESVVKPTIDWFTFLSRANASLGRSPTASLDEAGLAPGSIKTFLAALGEFQNPGTNPIPYLRDRASDRALEHLSFTFLVDATPECMLALLSLGKLNVLPASESVALVSGTLRQWREIIIEGCTVQANSDSRAMLNEILRHFVMMGLGDLFSEYDIVNVVGDKTIALMSQKQ